jgi:hypothetical protein
MRLLLAAAVFLFALYAADALYCDGVYFDSVQEMARHWRNSF